jgi:release factor glutamine methyltransferase
VINEVQDRVKIIRGDMFDYKGCAGLPDSLDAVICNPPYVCSGDIAGLQREVSEHEPVLALDGGEDGLAFYRAAGPWLALLMAGGLAAFEVGDGQAGDVTDILREAGLERIFVKKDYAGIGRVVGGYKR